MRKAMTDAELKLWNELRAHRLMGMGFRRQLPIAGYVVDFACPEHKIVVEVDGSGHGREVQRLCDEDRDRIRQRRRSLRQAPWRRLPPLISPLEGESRSHTVGCRPTFLKPSFSPQIPQIPR